MKILMILLMGFCGISFANLSDPIPLDSTLDSKYDPFIDSNEDGLYIVAWYTDNSIYARLFDSSTQSFVSNPKLILQESSTYNQLSHVHVAMNNNGEFVLVWRGFDIANNRWRIFSQAFYGIDSPASNIAIVPDIGTTPGLGEEVHKPKVDINNSGDIVISYGIDANNTTPKVGSVFVRTHVDNLTAFAPLDLFSGTVGHQGHGGAVNYSPDISIKDNGDFLFVWGKNSSGNSLLPSGTLLLGYSPGNSSATPDIGPLSLDDNTSGTYASVDSYTGDSSKWGIVWDRRITTVPSDYSILRRLDTNPVSTSDLKVLEDTELNATKKRIRVSLDNENNFYVVWYDDTPGIKRSFVRVFDESGNGIGAALIVGDDEPTINHDIVAGENGEFVVTYSKNIDGVKEAYIQHSFTEANSICPTESPNSCFSNFIKTKATFKGSKQLLKIIAKNGDLSSFPNTLKHSSGAVHALCFYSNGTLEGFLSVEDGGGWKVRDKPNFQISKFKSEYIKLKMKTGTNAKVFWKIKNFDFDLNGIDTITHQTKDGGCVNLPVPISN